MTTERIGRTAVLILCLILLALGGFSFWVAGTTQGASRAVETSSRLSDAYHDARFAISEEESLERKYRLEPGADVRARFDLAVVDLRSAMDQIARDGTAADRDLVAEVTASQESYLEAMGRLFAAVDAEDSELVLAIDSQDVDPIFEMIVTTVDRAASEHYVSAQRAVEDLQTTTSMVYRATPIAIVIALVAFGVVWSVMRSYQSQIQRAERVRVAAAIEHVRTTAKAQQDAIQASETRFRALVQNGSDLLTVVSPDGTIRYQSPSSDSILGRGPDMMLGRSLIDLSHPDDSDVVRGLIAGHGDTDAVGAREVRVRHSDGRLRTFEVLANRLPDDFGVESGVLLTGHDVTDRKTLEEQLRHQAFHDQLTGLPNRALFLDRLGQGLARMAVTGEQVTVLFLDLDDFKAVNDRMGHEYGDLLLREVSCRLVGAVRADQTVARIGGDEFTVLLLGQDCALAGGSADLIADALALPFEVNGHHVTVKASIGIASSPTGGRTGDDLLRSADLAMYAAKQQDRARWVVYDHAMRSAAWERLELETDLRRAIEHEEFQLVFQPIIDLRTGQVDSFEALVRWKHPQRGLVMPADFIPFAERSGLILPIGQWVLREACRQIRSMQQSQPGGSRLGISVNISARQFHHANLVQEVATILQETGLAPECLRLEVTESVMIQGEDEAVVLLTGLKGLGVRLAIDDFGTGYSSLAYLGRFPIDILKIDRSFVKRIDHRTEGREIIRMIIGLAKTLGLQVTGEGIEDASQFQQLRALGTDLGQGYYIGYPLSLADAEAFLRVERDRSGTDRSPSVSMPARPRLMRESVGQADRARHHDPAGRWRQPALAEDDLP